MLVRIATEVGAAAKFPGSGGAAIVHIEPARVLAKAAAAGMATDSSCTAAEQWEAAVSIVRQAYLAKACVFVPLLPTEEKVVVA